MISDKRTPDSPVCYIKGIGEKRAKQLSRLGIYTAYDLVTHYPRGYIDFNDVTDIVSAPDSEYCVIRARVTKKLSPYYGRVSVFKVIASDASGDVLITFFNNEYSFQRLLLDKEYCFYGKLSGDFLRREMNSPLFVDSDKSNQLMPRYRLTDGVSHNVLSGWIRNALDCTRFTDDFSDDFMKKYGLIDFQSALKMIHFPRNAAERELAKHRLAFEELFTLQIGLMSLKKRKEKLTGAAMKRKDISSYLSSLPFSLTGAQTRAINECMDSMCGSVPMNRLLQGDVGSGKTAVAAAVCFFAYLNGYQSTLMAPTEILAQQHYETLTDFLEPLGVKVELLTGSLSAAEKKKRRTRIADGEINVAVGTQALIQKGTDFSRLGLVITDEQHRFGVNQRAELSSKGDNPHILVMSATPIPRTLAMIIYGDLDITVLDEMPKGRLPVKTYFVDSTYRERLYKFILKYVNNGFQAYIVCPLIDESENEKANAIGYVEKLRNTCLKDISVDVLHGKMKQAEKDSVMQRFKNNETKILVSTTVIEVGVDVPNAVVMLIENAEQFGLSQLHQLRGRVGRGSEQAHCALISDNESETTKKRLQTMVKTTDGFEIANEDLALRGPGDFFGSRQHGLPELKIADICTDFELLEKTKKAAANVLFDDPMLEKPENSGIKRLVKRLFDNAPEI